MSASVLTDPPPDVPARDPDPDFTEEERIAYGFAPMPTHPSLHGLWHAMYRNPGPGNYADPAPQRTVTFTSLRFSDDPGDDPGPGGPSAGGRLSGSRNWSGAAALPVDGREVRQVGAWWTVPGVRRAGAGVMPQACSTWVGIGGFRHWMRSMPQFGTVQSVGSMTLPAQYFAWVQWWLRDKDDQPPFWLQGIDIQPGDEVLCLLTLTQAGSDRDTQRAIFELQRRRVGTPILTCRPMIMAPPTHNTKPWPTEAASAEWIVERPTALVDDGPLAKDAKYPLPEFDPVEFRDCGADTASHPSAPAADRVARDLTASRLIRLRVREDAPNGMVASVAVPRRQNLTDRFRIDYHAP